MSFKISNADEFAQLFTNLVLLLCSGRKLRQLKQPFHYKMTVTLWYGVLQLTRSLQLQATSYFSDLSND